MARLLYLICIFLPLLSGTAILIFRFRSARALKILTVACICAASAAAFAVLSADIRETVVFLPFSRTLSIVFRLDGAGRFFLGIVAALWPMTALYACSYMDGSSHLPLFFGFFCISYGITAGIALAGNLFTMYVFYELLTLSTVPLVIHPLTRDAIRAAKIYFVYCMGGAALGFASMLFLLSNGAGGMFVPGGTLSSHPYGTDITCLFYLLGFLGFGVKAAIFPLYAWLPEVSVAPTPVTALLHAVAVVKAGAFAVMRLTYNSYGTALLSGTWAQYTVMMLSAFTIFFGASRAVKAIHFKRRLVYSTVANLSYILFAFSLMTPAGQQAGLLHMAAHACTKILAFFCAGAVLHFNGLTMIGELEGIGKKMPVTFACFTCAALSLTGIPPFTGFVSKWHILTAAAGLGSVYAYIGTAFLLAGALLSAVYMFTVVLHAWFPGSGFSGLSVEHVREADWRMLLPMILLAAGTLLCGVFSGPIVSAAAAAAGM
ncbi:MAG: proton-conducting membrane transporter [Clostridia bacterium]|nr:proton-conducting membrane transporter [Clostridia bacterium]